MLIVSPISWSHHLVWAVPVALALSGGAPADRRAPRGSPCSSPARSCGRATATIASTRGVRSTTSSATPTCSRPSPCASGWWSRPVLTTGHGLGPDAVELGLQLQGPRLLQPVEATVDEGRLPSGLGPRRQLEQERPRDGDVMAFTEDVGKLMDRAAKPLRFPPRAAPRPPGRSAVAWPPCARCGAARRAARPLILLHQGHPLAGRSHSLRMRRFTKGPASLSARGVQAGAEPNPSRRVGGGVPRRPEHRVAGNSSGRRSCASRRPAASPSRAARAVSRSRTTRWSRTPPREPASQPSSSRSGSLTLTSTAGRNIAKAACRRPQATRASCAPSSSPARMLSSASRRLASCSSRRTCNTRPAGRWRPSSSGSSTCSLGMTCVYRKRSTDAPQLSRTTCAPIIFASESYSGRPSRNIRSRVPVSWPLTSGWLSARHTQPSRSAGGTASRSSGRSGA